ncbi:MAG: extracellular solute-binding protein [Chloroflexi bacterium]|nr:extracellular solute-binding protein [Chloroflexota bacterium]
MARPFGSLCQAGGVQIGLPLSTSVDLIFYDKSVFDAAGLSYPEPGWDWLTFQQTAQVLTSQGGTEPTRYSFVDNGRPLSLLGPLVDSLLLDNEDGLDSEQLAAELDWYVDFAQIGVIPALANDPQTALLIATALSAVGRRRCGWVASLNWTHGRPTSLKIWAWFHSPQAATLITRRGPPALRSAPARRTHKQPGPGSTF